MNPQNALSTPFTISNDGYLPILNVKYDCEIARAEGSDPKLTLTNSSVYNEYMVAAIWPGEKSPVSCDFLSKSLNFSRADVTVTVSYETQFLPGKWDKKFRFIGVRNTDGGLVWIPTLKQ